MWFSPSYPLLPIHKIFICVSPAINAKKIQGQGVWEAISENSNREVWKWDRTKKSSDLGCVTKELSLWEAGS